MANILDKFKTSVIGSNSSIYDYNSIISPVGDFTRLTGISVIMNSWSNILRTAIGSYDHDPDYGCDLHKYIFEPQDEDTRSSIIDTIKDRVLKFDNRAKVESVTVDYIKSGKGFVATLVASMGKNLSSLKINVTPQE